MFDTLEVHMESLGVERSVVYLRNEGRPDQHCSLYTSPPKLGTLYVSPLKAVYPPFLQSCGHFRWSTLPCITFHKIPCCELAIFRLFWTVDVTRKVDASRASLSG